MLAYIRLNSRKISNISLQKDMWSMEYLKYKFNNRMKKTRAQRNYSVKNYSVFD